MSMDSYFTSVPKGADYFEKRSEVEEKLEKAGIYPDFGIFPTSRGIAASQLYKFCPTIEEESFVGMSYWWLDNYMNAALSERGSTQDGVRLEKSDFEALLIELNKTLDSMDIEITYIKEERRPEYRITNPDEVYLGLLNKEPGQLNDLDFHWVANVWHFISRSLKEFPWMERDMYYQWS